MADICLYNDPASRHPRQQPLQVTPSYLRITSPSTTQIVQGRAQPLLHSKLNQKNRLEQLEKAEEEQMRIRLANMDVYEAEKNRLLYEFMKGRSQLSREELDDAIEEIERRQNAARYGLADVATRSMASDKYMDLWIIGNGSNRQWRVVSTDVC